MVAIAQILVAAGQGARAGGDIPKQYRTLGGKTVLRRTLDATTSHPDIQSTIVVVAEGDTRIASVIDGLTGVQYVTGGATRTDSVKAGLAALETANPDYVLIHDGARPFVTHHLISTLIEALSSSDAAVPVLPIVDAVKAFNDGTIGDDVSRETLRRVQTPQAFRYAKITSAFDRAAGQSFADDMGAAKQAGLSIASIPGDPNNIKLTYPEDFETAERMISHSTYTATGSGYDVHQVTDGDHVWLCGVKVPAGFSLLGHSDADVGLHALTDAILGALADGDIGDHFPPSDPQWKGASSDRFLDFAMHKVLQRGGTIEHVDITIICEAPKVKPHRAAMRKRVAGILNLDMARVSIKATTTEKLGFTGRGEGLATQAIATLRLPQ